MTPRTSTPGPLPGLWREFGEGPLLVRLDTPATTPDMVVVAAAASDWQRRPELRWQCWPQDLQLARWQTPGRALVLRAHARRLKPTSRAKRTDIP